MSKLRFLRRVSAAFLLLTTGLVSTAPEARADAQTDTVTPTAWRWRTNVSVTTLNADITAGYRIVDLEVEDDSPLLFSAVLVRNTGDYAKGWWWYYGQTESQVTARLSQHNARLIDVEPYQTSAGIRYAIVLIPNSGSDFALTHGWQTNLAFQQVVSFLNSNPNLRIIDIQPYVTGGNLRYAFTYVRNQGNQASGWWIYMNTTPSQITTALNQNNARLIDLEFHEGNDRVTALMVPNDGNAWFWWYNLSFGDVDRLARQYASRMIDFQRYRTGSGATRFAMVTRRNDNDLTVQATLAQRQFLPFDATSGILMRELTPGSTQTLAGTFEDRPFEPASLMKTVHHFVAARQVAVGNRSWNSLIIEDTGLNGSCPTGTNPVARNLRDVCRDMMESSSNTATDAIRQSFGASFIVSQAAGFGATSVALNHILGCLCGQTRNRATLDDLADLHGAVVTGALANERDDFYELMSNGSNFGMGLYNTGSLLDVELNASTLTATEKDAFRASLRFAHKGGSYVCISGSNREDHRSRGAYVRLPFRSGCNTTLREYFIGSWVNDAVTDNSANNATGVGIYTLYRERLRAAIDSWEAASCTNPFTNYCSANPNSTGLNGLCSATGSPFIVDDDLMIEATRLPLNSFGLLLVSPESGFAANPGGSAGNLCLGGAIGRYQFSIMSTGSSGTLSLPIDVGAIPRPSGPPIGVQAGDILHFQWWHRDTASNGGPTSNFTNGLRVTFI